MLDTNWTHSFIIMPHLSSSQLMFRMKFPIKSLCKNPDDEKLFLNSGGWVLALLKILGRFKIFCVFAKPAFSFCFRIVGRDSSSHNFQALSTHLYLTSQLGVTGVLW